MTSHERAVEVDTRLSELWEAANTAELNKVNAIRSLHSRLGHKWIVEGNRAWSTGHYVESTEDTEAEARDVIANPVEGKFWYRYNGALRPNGVEGLTDRLADLDAARAALRAAVAEAMPLEAEFSRERWSRFFLVLNNNGHIHKDMHCPTTFPTTRWAWLPSLSGLTEDAAVAAEGPRLCSICFPSAPVEWTLGLPKKVDPTRCPGSGEVANDIRRSYRPYGRCSVCGTGIAVSNTGKARPHKKPKGN